MIKQAIFGIMEVTKGGIIMLKNYGQTEMELSPYVYCRTYDETYVQPVLVPFNVLEETESHGIRLH